MAKRIDRSQLQLPLSVLPKVHPTVTVWQAQDVISRLAGKGSICPCCGQRVQLYPRTITSEMATWLTALYRRNQENEGDWVQIREIDVRGGDYAKLVLWGLVESKPKAPDDPDQRNSGYWRLTAKGKDFVMGKTRVLRVLWLYNNEVVLNEPDTLHITECFKNVFDYHELMGISTT